MNISGINYIYYLPSYKGAFSPLDMVKKNIEIDPISNHKTDIIMEDIDNISKCVVLGDNPT